MYQEYLDGYEVKKLAKKYELSYSTVNTIINSRKKELLFVNGLDDDLVNIIIKDYTSGEKIPDIAKKVNISSRKIERILNHKKVRTLLNSVRAPYKIDYFKELNNSKAYILGIMLSIYNIKQVTISKEEITFTVTHKQLELLELIIDEVFLIKPTIIRCGKTSYMIKSRDTNLIKDLRSFVTSKDLNIPEEYQDAFTEGIFEKSAKICSLGLTISCKNKIIKDFIHDYLMRKYLIESFHKDPFVVIIYSKLSTEILFQYSDAIRNKVKNSKYKNRYNI